MENNSKSLDEAIKAVQESAKRGQTRFWILSLSWIIVIITFSIIFTNVIDDFDQTKSNLDSLSTKLEIQERQFFEREKRLTYLEDKFSNIEFYLYNTKLNPEEKRKKTIEITERQLQREYTSQGEQQFLNSEIKSITDQENAEDFYLRGSSELNAKNYEKSIELLSRAIEIDPGLAKAYANRGRGYHSLKKYRKAIEDFTTAIKLGLSSSATYASRAFSYFKLSYVIKENNLLKALDDCNIAVEIDSSYWVSYHYKGFIYYKMGRNYYKEAEINWRRAAELRFGLSGKAGSLENIGLIYLSSRNWLQALNNCEEINSFYNRSAWNWLFLHIAASNLDKKDISSNAKERWNSLKSKNDLQLLELYLPKNLHHYMN